jgi:hypothetical protein
LAIALAEDNMLLSRVTPNPFDDYYLPPEEKFSGLYQYNFSGLYQYNYEAINHMAIMNGW